MCEYAEGCTNVTDPTAKALSENPRESDAIGLVLCVPRHHLLAVAYHLPSLGGDVLCVPHMRVKASSWLRPEDVTDPDKVLHWHPQIAPLDAFGPSDEWFGRCKCGTWSYRPASLPDMIAAHREGRILPQGDLAKVRHPSGDVTKMSRVWAESEGLEIVGSVVRSPRVKGPYISGSYVSMADHRDTRPEGASG